METDDVRIVAIGTALWLVALVATLVFHDRLAEHDNGDWVWIALAGIFLGFARAALRRRRQRPPPRAADRPAPPTDRRRSSAPAA